MGPALRLREFGPERRRGCVGLGPEAHASTVSSGYWVYRPTVEHARVPQMKVVLFCGGLGTRIREYSESIPKPMVPIGNQPILWHVMQYYSQYGHRDFILCLGYKANVIKDYFLNYNQTANTDCIISNFGNKVEILGEGSPDWRVSLIDTGIWRNIGQRLVAVRHLVKDEEVFLANYSDGLSDVPLEDMI